MPLRVVENQERAAEESHRIAALRRQALAEVRDVLVHADDAGHQARQATQDAGPEDAALQLPTSLTSRRAVLVTASFYV